MGYERNDRGYRPEGRGYGRGDEYRDRGREESGRGRDYWRADYGRDDYRRGDQPRGRGEYGRAPQGYDYEDRGFFDRAGDEVRSWFGDEEAERRRRYDERFDERYAPRGDDRGSGGRSWESEAADYGRGRDYDHRETSGRPLAYGQGGQEPRQAGNGWSFRDSDRGQQRSGGGGRQHDPHYQNWRDRQVASFDSDYEEYQNENRSRFESEFGSWRSNRQNQRTSLQQAKEHQEVVGSDGQHVGTVDHVRGDRIQLTKTDKDAGGHHHTIPSSWIAKVGDKVELNRTADDAKRAWREEQDQKQQQNRGGEQGGNEASGLEGPHALNRSFSGTY